MADNTETVTIERTSAIVALRALSQLWGEHVGGVDDDVHAAIEDIERVTGVRIELKSRKE